MIAWALVASLTGGCANGNAPVSPPFLPEQPAESMSLQDLASTLVGEGEVHVLHESLVLRGSWVLQNVNATVAGSVHLANASLELTRARLALPRISFEGYQNRLKLDHAELGGSIEALPLTTGNPFAAIDIEALSSHLHPVGGRAVFQMWFGAPERGRGGFAATDSRVTGYCDAKIMLAGDNERVRFEQESGCRLELAGTVGDAALVGLDLEAGHVTWYAYAGVQTPSILGGVRGMVSSFQIVPRGLLPFALDASTIALAGREGKLEEIHLTAEDPAMVEVRGVSPTPLTPRCMADGCNGGLVVFGEDVEVACGSMAGLSVGPGHWANLTFPVDSAPFDSFTLAISALVGSGDRPFLEAGTVKNVTDNRIMIPVLEQICDGDVAGYVVSISAVTGSLYCARYAPDAEEIALVPVRETSPGSGHELCRTLFALVP